MTAGLLILQLMCLIGAFAASGLEVALPRLNRFRLRYLARSGQARATWLLDRLHHKERFLWTLLVANVLCLFVFLVVTFYELWLLWNGEAWHWALSCTVLSMAIYLCIDMLPKIWFLQAPTQYALKMVPIAKGLNLVFHSLAAPLAKLMEWIVGRTDELFGFRERILSNRELTLRWIHEAAAMLPSEEQPLVRRVLELERTSVGALLTPMKSEYTVRPEEPLETVVEKIKRFGLKAVPVLDQEDNVIGLVDGKRILFQVADWSSETVQSWMEQPLVFRTDLILAEALEQLYGAGREVGIVIDRHHKPVGLVDMEHIMEFIFGELEL